jgi:hypothetical protein
MPRLADINMYVPILIIYSNMCAEESLRYLFDLSQNPSCYFYDLRKCAANPSEHHGQKPWGLMGQDFIEELRRIGARWAGPNRGCKDRLDVSRSVVDISADKKIHWGR